MLGIVILLYLFKLDRCVIKYKLTMQPVGKGKNGYLLIIERYFLSVFHSDICCEGL